MRLDSFVVIDIFFNVDLLDLAIILDVLPQERQQKQPPQNFSKENNRTKTQFRILLLNIFYN
jgi:hypothetical protein